MKYLPRYSVLLTTASLLFSSAVFAQSPARGTPSPKVTNPAPTGTAATGSAASGAGDTTAADKEARAKAATAPAPGMVLPTPAKDSPVASSITGSLDVGAAMDALQAQPYDVRDKLANEIQQRVTTSASRLDGLKNQTSGLTEDGKAQFSKAAADADTRKADVLKRAEDARKADVNAWEGSRSMLAASYATYAEAIARAELALSKTVTTPTASAGK